MENVGGIKYKSKINLDNFKANNNNNNNNNNN